MSDIQRYDVDVNYQRENWSLEEFESGDLVKYEDHAAIVAQLSSQGAVMNNREAMQKAFETCERYAGRDFAKTNGAYADDGVQHEFGHFLEGFQAGLASQAQQPIVTDEMIAAAEEIEDLYRRGTPDTWKKVFLAMWREMPSVQSQSQQESQWISVEERLPEMAQKVFGIYDAGMCAFMRVRSEDDTWCWAIGRNDLYDDFFYDADDDYQVTHWMPPAPEGDNEQPMNEVNKPEGE